jgi:hypothetical protein
VTDPALLDDAGYASAVLQARRGDVGGARAALAAVADLDPAPRGPRPSRAALELEPRAVIRGGLRRTRDKAITSQREQLLTVIDGDGVSLARAALEGGSAGRERRAVRDRSDPLAATVHAEAAPAAAPVGRERELPARAAAPVTMHPPYRHAAWLLLLVVAAAVWWIRQRFSEPGPRRS